MPVSGTSEGYNPDDHGHLQVINRQCETFAHLQEVSKTSFVENVQREIAAELGIPILDFSIQAKKQLVRANVLQHPENMSAEVILNDLLGAPPSSVEYDDFKCAQERVYYTRVQPLLRCVHFPTLSDASLYISYMGKFAQTAIKCSMTCASHAR